MTTDTATQASRYLTLRDYARVVRRYAVLIVILGIVGAAAGYVAAKRQTVSYQASSSVSFQDPTQQLSVVGLGSAFVQTPAQLASINAATATSPAVLGPVARSLKLHTTADSLAGAIAPQVSTSSGLLIITTSASTPQFAANLANAVANQLVAHDNALARAQYRSLAANVSRRIRDLTARSGTSGAANGQLAFYEDELARLNTVAGYTKTAQVANVAQVPPGPVSSNTVRNTVLGFVLGLLLGLLVAFVRDSTDRRLRTQKDVTEGYQLPLLGHVRERSMGKIVSSGGASGSDKALDSESFRILRRNLEVIDRDGAPGRILVTSAMPEEGKTTVASSLAMAIAATGRRTLLVDCDLRRPALAQRFGVETTPGLGDYLAGRADPQEILRLLPTGGRSHANATANGNSAGTGAGEHELVLIPAGRPTSQAAELLGSRRLHDLLAQVSEVYDVVVLDSSPLLPVADTLELLPHIDAIVVCARGAQTTREQASSARAVLGRFPERPSGLVITGIKPRDEGEFAAYSYLYG